MLALRRLLLCSSKFSHVRYPNRLFSSASAHKRQEGELSAVLSPYDLNAAGCNVPPHVAAKIGRNLHLQQGHPLGILRKRIVNFWNELNDEETTCFDTLSPVVSVTDNFDRLNFPPDHVSRLPSDTYYLDTDTVLRTHTSAHQVDLLSRLQNNKIDHFLVSGDVYRRDEIDRSHFPVFHQMECVKVVQDDYSFSDDDIANDLRGKLEELSRHLFGADVKMRWVDAYFPFTEPSFELEVFYGDEWLEVLGCGVVHPRIMEQAGREGTKGFAFGLGLERLAMVLFSIPDIRLFWSDDERFRRQFADGQIRSFQPYSKYPPCTKDISFWLPNTDFAANDLFEIVRDEAGDWVEEVSLVDSFEHPKTGRTSHCYRISYRSMDRNLTNVEIDAIQEQVRSRTADELKVTLR